jgi:hypothetical protein
VRSSKKRPSRTASERWVESEMQAMGPWSRTSRTALMQILKVMYQCRQESAQGSAIKYYPCPLSIAISGRREKAKVVAVIGSNLCRRKQINKPSQKLIK